MQLVRKVGKRDTYFPYKNKKTPHLVNEPSLRLGTALLSHPPAGGQYLPIAIGGLWRAYPSPDGSVPIAIGRVEVEPLWHKTRKPLFVRTKAS